MTLNTAQQPVPSSDPLMKAWLAYQQRMPPNDPLMKAWIAYQTTEGYQNTVKWAPTHPVGSLWAAFEAGWVHGILTYAQAKDVDDETKQA
jgi:hypothetical protein